MSGGLQPKPSVLPPTPYEYLVMRRLRYIKGKGLRPYWAVCSTYGPPSQNRGVVAQENFLHRGDAIRRR